jgi:hypothetical protein
LLEYTGTKNERVTMKYLVFLLVAATMVFASDDGCTDTSIGSYSPGSDAISLTLENDWAQSQQVLGLDAVDGSILGSDRNGMKLQFYDNSTGAPTTSIPLDAANTNCFGLAWNNNATTPVYHTNDWTDSYLYYTEDAGTSWATVTAPSGSNARGMDFDGTDYWCTNADGGGLWIFQPGGAQVNVAIPEVPTQPSGLAVFPYEGDLGVAVTTYNTHNFYFYRWDGSNMIYLGSAPCPVSGIAGSYGLTYAPNGNLYWSYRDGSGVYHLTEVSFSITSLARSSWGAIKTSF